MTMRLVEAMTNPIWWTSRAEFSNKRNEIIIYVEGKTDLRFFQINRPTLPGTWIFMTPPHEGGKYKVIGEVEWYAEQEEERWGIVDMDSDFQSEKVNLIQLTDTSPDCTLFWSIIRTASMDLMDLMGQMINECQKDGQLASDLHARLKEEGPEIIERMRLGTSRRLYLDHKHNHRFDGSHDQFSKQNGKGIERAGINDHVFESEMFSIFDSEGQDITREEIVRKLTNFLVNKAGGPRRRRDLASQILQRLGTSQSSRY